MGMFVNPDNSAFQVALNRVLNTLQGYICNSRPRRFGKSITANMLTAYYSRGCDSEAMFADLEISKNADFKKHLNQYDVIHLDIQWCLEPAGGAEQVVPYISERTIAELKEYYPDALSEDAKSLPEALSQINALTGKKFIVIIDEWDVLIRDKATNTKAQEDYINFLRGMFKGTEPTKYIQLAYLTGILPIKKEKTQSALNNFKDYSMLKAGSLASYVGFTEKEVHTLCERYGQDFEEVRRWYDGYQLGKYHVYNPNAVVNLMFDGDFQSYWSGTASYEAIVPLINMDFDGLKLDESLITNLVGNRRSRVVAKAVIDICHQLGCSVLAESVETQDQLNVLQELGCDYAQGTLFNKPIKVETFEVRYLKE